ncbi:MAG: winged helix-turn-helix domain-containing protein [Actinomycetota bacterium]|nr:winged helix-turn-helix domain-containing protein [Actinomycetota bacterium]
MAAPKGWTFLTHHGHVLVAVADQPDLRVTDIAERVGISTRAALTILKDLETAGYLRRSKVGRRTHYGVRRHRPFRHPLNAGHDVDQLLAIFTSDGDPQGLPSDSA